MENLKEFETIKTLMDFMVESAESDHFYEGGAVLNGQFIKLYMDCQKMEKFSVEDFDMGPHIVLMYNVYRVIIPSEMEYDIKEAIAEYKK